MRLNFKELVMAKGNKQQANGATIIYYSTPIIWMNNYNWPSSVHHKYFVSVPRIDSIIIRRNGVEVIEWESGFYIIT